MVADFREYLENTRILSITIIDNNKSIVIFPLKFLLSFHLYIFPPIFLYFSSTSFFFRIKSFIYFF